MTNGMQVPLSEKHVDVAIIGGGINGASAAQHLSAAGYHVLLVDQGDFADGATSRSSRLLHCGLRHLASGAGIWKTLANPARLARSVSTAMADMAARDEIVRTIPGRVKAFNFCLPIYEDDPYAPWHMDVAFSALRLMSPSGVPLDYRRYSKKELRNVPVVPWLRDTNELKSVAVFREYQFYWPERIALDALFDARRMGAEVHNYTKVEDLHPGGSGKQWHLKLRPVDEDRPVEVTADLVLNLAGAWVDSIIREADQSVEQKCLGLKGIHIAVRLPEEFTDWGVFAFNSIGEPLYCLPWDGLHYVGLTRTPHEGDASGVYASDAEIEWMVEETNRCLPGLSISPSDVLFSWAGVNPLTFDPDDPKGNRDIIIHDMARDGLPGLATLTGGAVVTHRRVARKLVQFVAAHLSPSGDRQNLIYQPGMSGDTISGLDDSGIVRETESINLSEVENIARNEQVRGLSDILMRRLGMGWKHDQGVSAARLVAETAAPVLGWNSEQIDREMDDYLKLLKSVRRRHGD